MNPNKLKIGQEVHYASHYASHDTTALLLVGRVDKIKDDHITFKVTKSMDPTYNYLVGTSYTYAFEYLSNHDRWYLPPIDAAKIWREALND